MASKKTGIYCFIVISLIAAIVINLLSPITTTWSLLLLPVIGFVMVRPKWKVAMLFFFLMSAVKYCVELVILKSDITMYHIVNTFVNFLIFHVVCYFIIKSNKLTVELTRLAIKDPLTGAYNRRYMEMFYGSFASETKNTLFLVDIDYFKQINDNFGHHFGDVILKRLVRITEEVTKETGLIIRLGGDEFAVVLPNTPLQQGELLAQQVRQKLANTIFPHLVGKSKVTISVGLTEFETEQDLNDVIARADKALYMAKDNGRNQIGCVR